MLKNYFKIAWRNLWKNKVFSLINILGLALGIACSMLIIFHVKDELSYDRSFSKSDRIFRINTTDIGDIERNWAAVAPILGSSMQQYFPEVKSVARFHRPYPYMLFSYTTQNGNVNRFEEKGGFFADSSAIEIFDLQFASGDRKTALSQSDAIILTEKMAKKYFGNEDPIGKLLQDDRRKVPMKVTGVVKEFPFSTHLQFDYLLSMGTIPRYVDQQSMQSRSWSGFYTYLLLNDETSKASVERKLLSFLEKYYPDKTRQEIVSTRKIHLQPIKDIHLYSKLEKEMYPNSDITYVYIFSVAALFILLVAGVNFVNISTAQAFNRMKEIGLRKVVGATKPQLVRQFLGESFITTLLATVLALFLFKGSLPFYHALSGKEFHFTEILTPINIGLMALLVLIIGLVAGFYPAWFVSNFNPVNSLKGKKMTGSSVNVVRRGLIVFQFVVSVFMIFSTIVIYRQMQLFHNKNLGFDKEQLVAVTMYSSMWDKAVPLFDEIRKNPAITSFTRMSTLPGERFSVEDLTPLPANPADDLPGTRVMRADDKLLPTLKISLKEGRNFFDQFPDIKQREFILNESAVNAFKLKSPIGAAVSLNGDTGKVVGVITDFNFASLHSQVEPMVIQYDPFAANYIVLKIRPGQLTQTLKFLDEKVKQLVPSSTFTYTIVDEKLSLLYESENRMSQVFKAFAGFAIFISCLGLFGLSAYAARLRIKELGIRKVLGASTQGLTLLLSKNFMILVLVATIISLPLAWWVMNYWLEGFAYRTTIDSWIFMVAGAFAFVVAFLTVSIQGIRAALMNPVKSLKTE